MAIIVLVGLKLAIIVHTTRQTTRLDFVLVSARVAKVAPVELVITGHLTIAALERRLRNSPTRAKVLSTEEASLHGSHGARLAGAHLARLLRHLSARKLRKEKAACGSR